MNARLFATLLGLVLSAAGGQMYTSGPLAQILPLPPSTPGLGELLADPSKWLVDMFNAALVTLGQKATSDVVGFMSWLMGDGNIISQTPPSLSYGNTAVHSMWSDVAKVADVALAVVAVWGGFNVMINSRVRAPYHGALELVPRLILCGVMVNTSLNWGSFVIDMNNAFCQGIGGSSIPGWDSLQQAPSGDSVLLNLIGMGIYLVMGLLLMGQMLMRLALVDAMLVIAPVALVCWLLPQTYSWARLWFTTFFGTVFVQSIQVLVLRLGTELIQQLPTLLSSIGANPAEGSHIWLATLLVGMAILQLTRKVPRLMSTTVGGIGTAWSGPSITQVRGLFNSGREQKSGR